MPILRADFCKIRKLPAKTKGTAGKCQSAPAEKSAFVWPTGAGWPAGFSDLNSHMVSYPSKKH